LHCLLSGINAYPTTTNYYQVIVYRHSLEFGVRSSEFGV
jgi:hypothetical protein